MGILRVILAVCVLDAHFPGLLPFRLFSGKTAVECFFMISGYYMALAYPKYTKPRLFYESRLTRILPPYYLVIIVSLGIFVASGFAVGEWGYLRALFTEGKFTGAGLTGWLAWVTNFTLVFQDVFLFLGSDHNLNSGNASTVVPLHAYLLLPVSWTIALELYFYILVPWLSSLRNRTLLGLLLLSLFLKIGGTLYGLSHDPWDYRFFPFELCLFLAGFLIYRISSAFLASNSHLPLFLSSSLPLFLSTVQLWNPRRHGSSIAGCSRSI